uniref:Uncharacterized protein n=1 Tax=Aureococcus anophagefferens TaxID=44056 RepID=A0A7U0KSC9_AURAN|nr:hypothetical protein [Aureococcus anophagefferens]QQW50301.1 hypothetical protein [Aureococcus anophagefferens]QQW50345.1 hypothetical protein [Aureococcus anophagefferens]
MHVCTHINTYHHCHINHYSTYIITLRISLLYVYHYSTYIITLRISLLYYSRRSYASSPNRNFLRFYRGYKSNKITAKSPRKAIF